MLTSLPHDLSNPQHLDSLWGMKRIGKSWWSCWCRLLQVLIEWMTWHEWTPITVGNYRFQKCLVKIISYSRNSSIRTKAITNKSSLILESSTWMFLVSISSIFIVTPIKWSKKSFFLQFKIFLHLIKILHYLHLCIIFWISICID